MTTPSAALKPCPCGFEDVECFRQTDTDNPGLWRVQCVCGWEGPCFLNKERAEAAWNTRTPAPTDEARAHLETLRVCVDELGGDFYKEGHVALDAIRALLAAPVAPTKSVSADFTQDLKTLMNKMSMGNRTQDYKAYQCLNFIKKHGAALTQSVEAAPVAERGEKPSRIEKAWGKEKAEQLAKEWYPFASSGVDVGALKQEILEFFEKDQLAFAIQTDPEGLTTEAQAVVDTIEYLHATGLLQGREDKK